MRPRRVTAVIAAALTAIAATAAAEGEPTVDLSLDSAVVADGDLDLAGSVVFAGTASKDDPSGDTDAPGAGTDIASTSITQTGDTLRVEMRLHDATPAGGIPETVRYVLTMPKSGLPGAELHAWTSTVFFSGFGDASPGSLYTSIDYDGDGGYLSQPVTGGLLESGDGIFWEFTLAEAQLTSGDRLSLTPSTQIGVVGTVKNPTAFDTGSAVRTNLGGRVDVTIVDAEGLVVAGAGTTAAADGSWDASIDVSGLAPGTYTVTATSEYGDDLAEATTTFEVG